MVKRLDQELERTLLDCCRVIAATDRSGRVVWALGEHSEQDAQNELTVTDRFATSVDLVASAVRRLGQDLASGDLDTFFVRFEEEMLMAVAVPDGHVCLLAEATVTPGLLFSYVRRLQLALEEAA